MYIEKTYSLFLEHEEKIKAFAISVGAHSQREYTEADAVVKRVINEILDGLYHLNIIDGWQAGEKVKQYGKD